MTFRSRRAQWHTVYITFTLVRIRLSEPLLFHLSKSSHPVFLPISLGLLMAWWATNIAMWGESFCDDLFYYQQIRIRIATIMKTILIFRALAEDMIIGPNFVQDSSGSCSSWYRPLWTSLIQITAMAHTRKRWLSSVVASYVPKKREELPTSNKALVGK